MKPLEFYVKPALEFAKYSRPVTSGVKPLLNNNVSTIYAPKLGAEVSLILHGNDTRTHLNNAVASYTPDFLKILPSIWRAFETAAEKIGDATGDFQAAIIGGVKGEKYSKISQDSENFFYGILEGCYKKGYNYTAIGLKSPEANLDTVYVTPSGIYLQNNDFKKVFNEKKLHEYTQEEVEQLLSGVYDYMEIGQNHKVLAGDRLAFLRSPNP